MQVAFTDALGIRSGRLTPALAIGRDAAQLKQLVAVRGLALPICQSLDPRALLVEEPAGVVAPRRAHPRVRAACAKDADGSVTLTLRARREGASLGSVLRSVRVVVGRARSGPALGPDARIGVRWATSGS